MKIPLMIFLYWYPPYPFLITLHNQIFQDLLLSQAIEHSSVLKVTTYEWNAPLCRYRPQNELCGPSMDVKWISGIKIIRYSKIRSQRALNQRWSSVSRKIDISGCTIAAFLIRMAAIWWKSTWCRKVSRAIFVQHVPSSSSLQYTQKVIVLLLSCKKAWIFWFLFTNLPKLTKTT